MPDSPSPRLLAHELFAAGAPGVPVVLLHAFPLERSMWTPVAERLAAATVPVIAVDLPGLGESPLPAGPADLASSAAGVVDLLDGLERPDLRERPDGRLAGRAVVAGVSMGGYVALALARSWPHRLAGLALVDTKAEADGDEARANRLRVADSVLGDAGTAVLEPMLDVLLGATTRGSRPDVVRRVRDGLASARPEGVAWSQRAMAARPDATGLLAGIRCPAAVLVGEEDGLTPPAGARAMAEALPDAVLTVVPRAGHLSPLEAPDAVADALLALVLRVSG